MGILTVAPSAGLPPPQISSGGRSGARVVTAARYEVLLRLPDGGGELVQFGGHREPDGVTTAPGIGKGVDQSSLSPDERHARHEQIIDWIDRHPPRLPSEVDRAQSVRRGTCLASLTST